jgi:ABC-type transport system involved in multi-copper enzyme maturation permease subunit
VDRQFGSTSTQLEPTQGRATFDHVSPGGEWISEDLGSPPLAGSSEIAGDTVIVTGSGDMTRIQIGDDDVVVNSLAGVLIAMIVVSVVSVLFITAEFRRGLIRTSLTASPRRGRVLVAKALVIAAVAFVVGLLAAGGSYVLARPAYAGNGFTAPAYPELPLHDPTVLRAVIGSALVLALVGVFGVSLGAILRRGAGAIALVLAVLVAPPILLGALPLDVALWIGRSTPIAGFAVQQTRERWDTAIGPWAGLGVLAGYAAVALAVAVWRLRRRDA